MPKRLD